MAEYASTYGNDYDRFIDDIEQAKEQLAYTSPFEDDGASESTESQNRLMHLMTALRAKGKEFDTVVLLDVVDGIWPHKNANQRVVGGSKKMTKKFKWAVEAIMEALGCTESEAIAKVEEREAREKAKKASSSKENPNDKEPSDRKLGEDNFEEPEGLRQLEAERRVFYVAFTRAKQRVVMLVPTHFGDKETAISPYVQELGL